MTHNAFKLIGAEVKFGLYKRGFAKILPFPYDMLTIGGTALAGNPESDFGGSTMFGPGIWIGLVVAIGGGGYLAFRKPRTKKSERPADEPRLHSALRLNEKPPEKGSSGT